MLLPDKSRIFAALLERVRADLAEALRSQQAAHAAATHEEMRAEGPKDMRSTEVSYLARGLAERVESLAGALRILEAFAVPSFAEGDAIAVGALIVLEDEDGSESAMLLVPAGGGEKLLVDGATIRTLTPPTPLGRLLAGRCLGDEIVAELPAGRRELTVVGLA